MLFENKVALVVASFVTAVGGCWAAFHAAHTGQRADKSVRAMPLFFVESPQQQNEYVLNSGDCKLLFTRDGITWKFPQMELATRIEGLASAITWSGLKKLPGLANFYLGDSTQWRHGTATWGSIVARDIYPGIDLTYAAQGQSSLKSEFVVRAGVDPRQIKLGYDQAVSLVVDARGDLVIDAGRAKLRERRPVAWQVIAGAKVYVPAEFKIAGKQVSFGLGRYDPAFELVIDPVLTYSSYFGGSGFATATGVAVDGAGNIYLGGWTETRDIPFSGTPQSANGVDAFVAKLASDGQTVKYVTYLGGAMEDKALGIAVDSGGNVVAVGETHSSDWPTAGAIQSQLNGTQNAFVAKLDPSGTIVFCSYLGGSGVDSANGVAVDLSGSAYLTGSTSSTDFPLQTAYQSTNQGGTDAFAVKISSGGGLLYSTYLGGSGNDQGNGIAVDNHGQAVITGGTFSSNFPLASALQASNHGGQDVFVTRFYSDGSGLSFSTYLGGSGGTVIHQEQGTAVAVDSVGSMYVTGITSSSDFPLVSATQSFGGGSSDAFVAKISSTGTLAYSTYLGGSSLDWATGLVVDASGSAWVGGYTSSTDFPLSQPIQTTLHGYDGFLVNLDAGGQTRFSSFFGGAKTDSVAAVAMDANGSVYIAGLTQSTDYPVVNPVQSANYSGYSGFVTRVSQCTYVLSTTTITTASSSSQGTISVTTPTGCAILASSNTGWITAVVSGTTVTWAVAANSGTARSGTLTIAGQPVSVNQAGGCTYSLGQTAISIGPASSSGQIAVTVSDNSCPILASSSAGWITAMVSGTSVTWAVAANSGTARSGTLTIAGQSVSVNQAGGCVYSLGQTAISVGPANSSGQMAVTVSDNSCPILASSNTGWITAVVSGTTVTWAVAANSGTARSGVLTIAGQPVSINQAGGCTYSLGQTAINVGAGTSSGQIGVTASDNSCPVLASSNVEWITATVSGTRVTWTVAANSGTARSGILTIAGQPVSVNQGGGSSVSAQLSVDLSSLTFGVSASEVTGAQTIQISAPAAWTATSNQPNIIVSPTSGTGAATLQVSVTRGPSGVISITAPGASGSPLSVTVRVITTNNIPPYGSFDTPQTNSTQLIGNIAVTGWALDNIQVTKVDIWREPIGAETPGTLVYIGDADFVDGARPDVEAARPDVPFNYRAGWGYMMLTNMLPNSNGTPGFGNGTYRLHALAHDAMGLVTDLGTKIISIDNAHATLPFGTIDTPGQGATTSGSAFVNYGWALTPKPSSIPNDGSTIWVVIDGETVGHPIYNNYRSDIATLFPGYANSSGAIGYYVVDTTRLKNGPHTIAWIVSDSLGRAAGIGSRFFTVFNSDGQASSPNALSEPITVPKSLEFREGLGQQKWKPLATKSQGIYRVDLQELGYIELRIGAIEGATIINGSRRSLPVGSSLKKGTFRWQLGPGFWGTYMLEFSRSYGAPIRLEVRVMPRRFPVGTSTAEREKDLREF